MFNKIKAFGEINEVRDVKSSRRLFLFMKSVRFSYRRNWLRFFNDVRGDNFTLKQPHSILYHQALNVLKKDLDILPNQSYIEHYKCLAKYHKKAVHKRNKDLWIGIEIDASGFEMNFGFERNCYHNESKFWDKSDREIFDELSKMNLLGQRAGEVIFLTESGFWKLVMQSRKSIGIKTRDWLANEVLPSIRKTGTYSIASNNPMAIFTERNKQLELAKKSNSILSKTKDPEAYSKFWNDLHLLVVGLDAKSIKAVYKSKESAKEVLRKHAPHLEATEAVIEDIWASGIEVVLV